MLILQNIPKATISFQHHDFHVTRNVWNISQVMSETEAQ